MTKQNIHTRPHQIWSFTPVARTLDFLTFEYFSCFWYLFNITKLGLKQSLAKAQMIQSGNFFVFEQKIQFLLNNGLKFEV